MVASITGCPPLNEDAFVGSGRKANGETRFADALDVDVLRLRIHFKID